MNENLLISIITVCYNSISTIEKTILSVINQSYQNIEYIVIDGGSTDGTVDIIKKYEKYITYWVSESDKGIYDAINKGILIAKGDVIGLINADDWYESDAISKCMVFYKEQDIDVLYGNMRFIRFNGRKDIIIPSTNLKKLKSEMIICHPASFITKNAYNKWGLYNDTYKIAGDYELIVRMYLKGAKFKKINVLISNFTEGGISSNFTLKNFFENKKVRKEHNLQQLVGKEIFALIYFKIKKVLFKNKF